MAVTVTEFKGLDPARGSIYGIADRVRAGAGERGLAILFPRSIPCLESRRREGIACAIEPLVQVVAAGRRGVCANLLEVPAQLVDCLGLDRRQELIPHDLFERWAMSGHCGGTTIRSVHAGSARSSAA